MLSPFAIFSEERMRLGIAKFEKQVFPFASALTFHYLCKRKSKSELLYANHQR